MCKWWRRNRSALLRLVLAFCVSGCAAPRFERVGEPPARYEAAFPYYAEFCALSQIKKLQGFGADIRGGIGGHSVFYLNGACRKPGEAYPVLELCETGGAGLSMNDHFRNAKWAATPGRNFFFDGDLPEGAPVTRQTYAAVRREAKRLGIYDGITFHRRYFADMPAGWTPEEWKYEISIGTDYAVALARGRYCARVPVDRAAMARMIDFLNRENAPYRAGAVFHWSVFNDNCIHLAHNALAAAGLWKPWPTGRFVLIAMFDFPVPRNEFVNLMRRTNDDLPRDPGEVYRDLVARQSLLQSGELPTRPGALAESRPPLSPNAVYETTGLKLIFYDEPTLGPYQGWFDQIFADPRYTDLSANRAYFALQARRLLADRKPLSWWVQREPYARDPVGFARVYERFYALMAALEKERA